MNSVILYIKNKEELALLKIKYLDTNLLEDIVAQIKTISFDKVYLVGEDKFEGVINVENLSQAFKDIEGHDGKTLLLSPLCANLKRYHYEALLKEDKDALVVSDKTNTINVYMLKNSCLNRYKEISYKPFIIESDYLKTIKSARDVEAYGNQVKLNINNKHIDNGVTIIDKNNTYIGPRVEIESGATIYPNVVIEGKTKILKGATVSSNSYIIDSEIGVETKILSSRIDSSIVHDNVSIGPNSHLRGHSEVFEGCRIGNFVEFKNTKFGKGSKCAHLTYLGDSVVGEGVNIGCGVVTVNYDGVHKYATIIKDHAFIGSNANLIAPVTIGEYTVVAAGSTITNNVDNEDMAIARARQVTKKGYGIKYIKKEK